MHWYVVLLFVATVMLLQLSDASPTIQDPMSYSFSTTWPTELERQPPSKSGKTSLRATGTAKTDQAEEESRFFLLCVHLCQDEQQSRGSVPNNLQSCGHRRIVVDIRCKLAILGELAPSESD